MTIERDKVVRKIGEIIDNYHFAPNDGELHGKYFPNNLAFMALSYLLDRNHLLIGDPGWGKTTAAQLISSVFSGIPVDLYEALTIEGHPGLFTEKWKARPNYGALAKEGAERVIWQGSFGLDTLIVDEINRVPPDVQDEMLEGIRTGRWKYLNDVLYEGKKPTFMTMNHRDDGNGSIIPPLEDRIDIVTEEVAGSPLSNYAEAEERVRKDLSDPEAATAAIEALRSTDFAKFKAAVARTRGTRIKDHIVNGEKKNIQEQIKAMEWDNDAYYFLWTFAAEINFSQKYGTKRTEDPISDNDHDNKYAGFNVENSFSPRPQMAARLYSQGLAWLLGDSKVELDHVRYVLPHVSAHKLKFTDGFRDKHGGNPRTDYEALHLAKELVRAVETTYDASVKPLKSLIALIQKGKIEVRHTDKGDRIVYEGAERTADDFDHPLISHLVRSRLLSKKLNL